MKKTHNIAFLGLCALVGIGVNTFGTSVVLGFIVMMTCVLAFALPIQVVFMLALAGNLLIPLKYLPFPSEPATLNPGLALMAILFVRLYLERARLGSDMRTASSLPPVARRLLLCSVGWIAIGVLHSPARNKSLEWAISFVMLAVLPPLVAPARRFAEGAKVFLIGAGGVLGGFAVLEAFVLKANPIYGNIYSSGRFPLLQEWSVYRATTLLGHPLINATVFVVAVPFALVQWRQSRNRWCLLAAGLALAGIIATQSRAGMIAGAVAVAVPMILWQGKGRVLRNLIVLVAFGLMLSVGASYVDLRSGSSEGRSSQNVRAESLAAGKQLAGRAVLTGVGPGLADYTKRTEGIGNFKQSGIENSWIELIVALGLPGFAMIAIVYALAVHAAYLRRNIAALGALVGYGLMALGFNLIEVHQPTLILLGFILVASFGSGGDGDADLDSEPGITIESGPALMWAANASSL